jgi:hypothetical protein
MFAATGYGTGIVFIVSRNKEITWSAIPERWNMESKKWCNYWLTYRASIISSRKELEQLIWNDSPPSNR